MNNLKLIQLSVLLMFVSSLLACPASYAISLSINGETVFYDDFESGTTGEAFGPVEGPPRWSFNFRGPDHKVEVMDAESSGPGAVQGDRYGHLTRGGDIATVARASNLPVINDGDLMHAEFMLYIPSGQTSFGYYLAFADTADTRGVSMSIFESGDVLTYNHDIGAWDLTGLSFQFDTWQKWEQDWVVGSAEKTISVDGSSVTVTNGADSGGAPITTMYLGTVTGSDYFVDAVPATNGALTATVPEPSSSLLILIAFGLAVARRSFLRS